jgi:ferredoxin-NADP reductase
LFIAGGIGITPLVSKIAAAAEGGASWRLLYGGRRRDSMALLDELAPYGDRVAVMPEDELGLLPLRDELSRMDADSSIHVCGPKPLIGAVEKECQALQLTNLHIERFAPIPVTTDDADAFVVNARRSGISVTVAKDRSILETLEAAGLDPLNSCREGICGTCETKVLAGCIDHRDSLLSEEERAAGSTMMICVSRGRGELDLDI